MSRTAKFWIAAVIVLAGAQLIRPQKTNPPEDPARTLFAHAQPSAEVAGILKHSCRDCHSYNTRWPWYSNVAPVSWMVIDDVNEGRRHFNMSDWGQYDTRRASEKLGNICDEVADGGMPERSYTWLHSGAALSAEQRNAVCLWTQAERERLAKAQPTAPSGK
ncbi:MAG TPA: heme-binding domain-containing protein [Terriglobales bacterium]|nr:heme-binding domain-containing protein [Terriglobales bacterium]